MTVFNVNILSLTEEPISFSGTMVRGGQIHVRNVIEGLRERGHNVHLVDWNENPETDFQHSIAPRLRFVIDPARTVRQAIRVDRDIDVDVVISKTRKTYLPGLVTANILNVPHVVHIGSSLNPPRDGLLDRFDNASFVTRIRAPHNAYLVVCDAISRELQQRGINPERIYDVRNAVDTDRFCPNPDVTLETEVSKQLNDCDEPILGFVGGLFDYKGVFDLAAAIEQTETEPTVVVAGDGPARERFEAELGSEGVFLGSVPYEEMPAVYAAFDALVLPSHTEGLPRVLLEAGAAGKPVIATTVGGVPEVVNDRVTGILCMPRNPERLAATIDNLFTNGNATQMGDAARSTVLNQYTWAAQYDRYESFLDSICAANTYSF